MQFFPTGCVWGFVLLFAENINQPRHFMPFVLDTWVSLSRLLLLSPVNSALPPWRGDLTHRLLDQGGWSESPGARRGQGSEFLKGSAAKGGVTLSLESALNVLKGRTPGAKSSF